MRILFIAPYLPSLIRVRPYNFIKALAKRGHDISLLCLVQSKNALNGSDHLRRYCDGIKTVYLSHARSMLNALLYSPTSASLQAAYCFSRQMRDEVERAVAEHRFDVVHIEHIRAAHFLPRKSIVPAIFDSVDCITFLYEQFSQDKPSLAGRWSSRFEYWKLRGYEPREASKFERVIVTSQKDRDELNKLAAHLEIDVVSNGVDLEYFRATEDLGERGLIAFSGKMSYYANEAAAVSLCSEILPLIKAREPKVNLTVVGGSPSRRVLRYASEPGIEVTGYVADIRVHLRSARVAVCPVSVGAGVQNKVIEAMAMGKPVVATSKACQALSVRNGEHLLVADEPKAFADAVVRILHDDALARRLGQNGRKYVENHHNWDEKARQLEETYHKAVASMSVRQFDEEKGIE